MMKRIHFKVSIITSYLASPKNQLLFCILAAIIILGCSPPAVPWTGSNTTAPRLNIDINTTEGEVDYDWDKINSRPRSDLPENPFDGSNSFWTGENTWGNFFRSNKAQFVGDILQVRNVSQLIPDTEPANRSEQEIQNVQNEVDEVTAEIVDVLNNGLLVVYAEKTAYSRGDNIRFVTTLSGFIRPMDISEANVVDAQKIYKPELKTTKAYKLGNIDQLRRQELQEYLTSLEEQNAANAALSNSSENATSEQTDN